MSSKSLKMFGLMMMAVAFAGAVYAQEGAAPAQVTDTNYFDLYTKGGPIGFFITFLSIISMTLSIKEFMNIKREKLIPNYVITDLEGCIEDDDIDAALDLCDNEEAPIAKIMGSALSRYENGPEKMSDAMADSSEEQANILTQRIGWLNLIGGLAPMIGLFGTVSGMVKAFDTIAQSSGTASPEQLAKGIMEALVTTFLGLLVAIPTIVAYHYLKNQVVAIMLETNNICSELLDKVNQK